MNIETITKVSVLLVGAGSQETLASLASQMAGLLVRDVCALAGDCFSAATSQQAPTFPKFMQVHDNQQQQEQPQQQQQTQQLQQHGPTTSPAPPDIIAPSPDVKCNQQHVQAALAQVKARTATEVGCCQAVL